MAGRRPFAELHSRLASEAQAEGVAETFRVSDEIASSEQPPETLALLTILALGNQDVMAGRTNAAADIIARLRAKG
ncbi:hypothetical protein BB934_41475 (plasmid) [Microvirga ossetica]|uniref:Uncharacterized protein n=1 Tax=Microvirga ossetica TaxID=1882682 RepID=A0A1B2EXI2_9HYPH|nr:hypothetical protein BB934_41475 [Microvirga ossetica]